MEVNRVVTERSEGIVLGSLLTPLGLIQAIILYALTRTTSSPASSAEQGL
jgi:hypothetical protein